MNDLLPWPSKTPAERFPVGVDWSPVASGAALSNVTVGADAGSVIVDDEPTTFGGLVQTVHLAGGTPGEYASFTCQATFDDGRILVQRFYLFVT